MRDSVNWIARSHSYSAPHHKIVSSKNDTKFSSYTKYDRINLGFVIWSEEIGGTCQVHVTLLLMLSHGLALLTDHSPHTGRARPQPRQGSLPCRHPSNLPGPSADPVPGDEPQLGAVLQEDVAGVLRWVDPDAVVRDDGRRRRRHAELLGRELEHRREGRVLRHGEHLERQLRVGRQRDLEGDFGGGGGHGGGVVRTAQNEENSALLADDVALFRYVMQSVRTELIFCHENQQGVSLSGTTFKKMDYISGINECRFRQ